jgi:thiamine pyridinylase
MKNTLIVLVLMIITLSVSLQATCKPTPSQSGTQRHHLRVVLYPFIPEFNYAAETVKRLFEAENPNIELSLIDLSANYYAPSKAGAPPDPTYIGDVQADVYELDSVFLADFVNAWKIQVLPEEILLPANQLLESAFAGSMLDGKRYGSAHWACGNFLFFTKDSAPSMNPTTLNELEGVLGADAKPKLLVDLRGRLTLGEFYLGSAYAKYKDWVIVKEHMMPTDESVESNLVRVLKLCPSGSCRDQIFHEITGIYGQEFALGRSKALVGYSELLHSVLTEGMADDNLRVAALPLDDAGTVPISWIDSFTVRTNCTGDCYQDAARFIRFMQRDDVYLKLLLPDRPSFLTNPDPKGTPPIPAYLLPAKASLYSNVDLIKAAHLYPDLKRIIERASVPTAINLNKNLRIISADVDAALSKAVPK